MPSHYQKGEKTMTSMNIIVYFAHFIQHRLNRWRDKRIKNRANLHHLSQKLEALPQFVRESPVAMRYLHLLGPLAWDQFPERNLHQNRGTPAVPYAPFVAACLIKLDQQFVYMSQLRQYLVDHPALVWLLGFPLVPSLQFSWGFDVEASLPTHRHFTRMLRQIHNPVLQALLDSSVTLIRTELADIPEGNGHFGQAISLDTKHILAWVAENNPKAYINQNKRLDKTCQPKGDPDCRLGCKRKRNQPPPDNDEPPPKLTKKSTRSTNFSANDEYFWGYGSGVVATKIPNWGEVILAELTLTFDQSDVAYFFPLMADAERRLGFRPKFGALDAAFDAFYVYEFFHSDEHDGFAAVPFVQHGGYKRAFDPKGLPLCTANLPMPLKSTFQSKTGLIEHQKGRYACPLLFPQPTGQSCPINHNNWRKAGCVTALPTSIGARLRYQLDRHSDQYKQVFRQRTATERINAQAEALGIERPKLRNQKAIANQNTLIYTLINLRTFHRIRQQKSRISSQL
jgi:hypothetical protein